MSFPQSAPETVRPRVSAIGHSLSALLQAGCFWAAVSLPLSYPLLWMSGVLAEGSTDLVLSILAVHLLALLGGRNHHPPGLED